MAEKKDKFVEAVAKLIKLTQDGKIEWRSAELVVRDDFKVESVFSAAYKDKLLRIYKYVYKVEEPDPFQIAIRTFTPEKKYPYWATSVTLEFIDIFGISLWKFPYTNAVNDLLQAVQYQVADVDEFLNEIIIDE